MSVDVRQSRVTEAEAALDDAISLNEPHIEDLASSDVPTSPPWQPSSPDPVWTSPRCPPWTRRTSTMEATAKMPYDFSPARVRYEERDIELLHSADQNGDTTRTC
ncbi:hypothetical protein F3K43_44760 [Streptomyces sp. LBUM 1476]|nr:hypothetical protein [Streptomyces sp. LBUM 1476]